MLDSTALVDDPAAIRARIREEGYVLLRRLVDPQLATDMGKEIREIVAAHGFTAYDGLVESVLKTPLKGQETDDYWDMYGEVLALESVNALPHVSGHLRQVITSLLGETAFSFPMKTVRLVFPQVTGGAAIPPHRDNRGGPWVQDMFTTWVALGEIDRAMGGFAILRDSHTYRYQAVYEDRQPPSNPHGEPIPDLTSPQWVSTEWQPGDVVLFHCYALHQGLFNNSSRVRVSVDYRWQTTDHPVHYEALLPYHYLDKYPKIPDWDSMSKGWSEPTWSSYPADVPVTREKWPLECGFRIPPSRFVDVEAGAEEAWRSAVRERVSVDVPFTIPEPS